MYIYTRYFFLVARIYPYAEARDNFTTIQNVNGCLAKHNYNEDYEISMSNVFVTGCDHNTECNSWFIENFERYNDTKLIIADFGIMNYPDGDYTYIDIKEIKHKVGLKNLQL